jgi:hypothetical protein
MRPPAATSKNLDQAQLDCRKRRGPSQRNPRGIFGGDREKDNRRHTQDGRDDRDETCIDLETAEEPPDDLALQKSRNDQSGGEKPGKGNEPKNRYVMMANVKQRPLQKRYLHVR